MEEIYVPALIYLVAGVIYSLFCDFLDYSRSRSSDPDADNSRRFWFFVRVFFWPLDLCHRLWKMEDRLWF